MPAAKKKAAGAGWKLKTIDLECPSGEWCRVRKPNLQGLLNAGALNAMDSLTGIVVTEVIPGAEGARSKSAEETREAAISEALKDPKKMEGVFTMMDSIVMYQVVEPNLLPVPAEGVERDEEAVYIDDVDMDDKIFIMNHALSGTAELQPFRPEAP